VSSTCWRARSGSNMGQSVEWASPTV